MDLTSILFYFSFIFSYLLEYKTKKTKVWHCHKSHDTVTEVIHSCDIEKGIEGSGTR